MAMQDVTYQSHPKVEKNGHFAAMLPGSITNRAYEDPNDDDAFFKHGQQSIRIMMC